MRNTRSPYPSSIVVFVIPLLVKVADLSFRYISFVPTSAHSGDGMGNLVGLIVQLSENFLAQRLAFAEDLQVCTNEGLRKIVVNSKKKTAATYPRLP